MNPTVKVLLTSVAVTLLALASVVDAAPRQGGGSAGARPPSGSGGGGARHGYSGGGPVHGYRGGSGYHHYGGSGYGHSHGYRGSYWGWGVGLAVGVPWGWGWYDPYWYGSGWGYGNPYYAYPAYGYAAPYGYGCWPYGDCYREQVARTEPTPPTTEVPPPAPGESGMPTQRPLHLNYCDSAGAWFPQVTSCPGGWRLVPPDYSQGR